MLEQLIGQSLSDRYLIKSLLGKGGMGAVYQAEHIQLGHTVAIKVMYPNFASQPNFRQRFLQEAQTAAKKLTHPGIVKVHDYGEDGSIFYMVMEYIAGQNLQQWIQSFRAKGHWFGLGEALMLVRQVCQAVHYAHQQGVLHRDIKPANIMLKPESVEGLSHRPVITDLGLAKLLTGELETQTGRSMGTPAYMSPEQALGQETDARSDIYSLGILLYQLTVGELPFSLKTITEAFHHHSQEPPLLPPFHPELPDLVRWAILKALKRDPKDRFADAAALAEALVYVHPRVPPDSHPPTVVETVPLETQYPQMIRPPSIDEFPTPPPDLRQDRIVTLAQGKVVLPVILSPEGVTIGRQADNDLVLDDPTVSGHHARVELDGTNYQVVDLSSTNGTLLAKDRLLPDIPKVWTPDKILRIGKNFLQLQLAAPVLGETSIYRSDGTMVEPHLISTSIDKRVAIFMEPTELEVEPGSSVTASLTILNQASVVDHFRVSVVEGEAEVEWVSASPPEVQLLPGMTRTVALMIKPPRSPQIRAGEHRLEVKVASQDVLAQEIQETPGGVATQEAKVNVAPYQQFSLDFVSAQQQRGPDAGEFEVQLTNQGNANATVQLAATDPERACQYSFDPDPRPVFISLGEAHRVKLKVIPQSSLVTATERIFLFTVTGQLIENPEVSHQVQGIWIQTPLTLKMVLHPQKLEVETAGEVDVEVTNESEINLAIVQFEAADPEEAYRYEFEPAELDKLGAGQTCSVKLTVLPKDPQPRETAKTYPFTVTARLAEAPGLAWQSTGEFRHVPPPEVKFNSQLYPQQIRAGQTAQVKVKNQGQRPEIFTVKWQDRAADLILPDPTEVKVLAGQEKVVEFRPTLRRSRWGGGKQVHHLTVQVCPARGEPQTLSGEVISRGWFPTLVLPILAFICLLCGTPALLSIIPWPPPLPTPTPPPTAPEIAISADQTIMKGECTTLSWNIENVQAVYLDGSSVPNQDEWEVCPETMTTYVWRVVGLDGRELERDRTITVIPISKRPDEPDLAVTDITWDDDERIRCSYRNIGDVEIPKQDIWMGIGIADAPNYLEFNIGQGPHFPLPPRAEGWELTEPIEDISGETEFWCVIAYEDVNEDNNELAGTLEIGDQAELPDLTVVDIAAPHSAEPGATELVTVDIQNESDGTAKGTNSSNFDGYTVDIVFSSDTEVPESLAEYSPNFSEDMLLDRISSTDDIDSGHNVSYDARAEIPSDTPPGSYYICARADPGQTVAESEEQNNVHCTAIQVTEPAACEPGLIGNGAAYTVQADDWLANLAEKFYGDIEKWPAIVYYANLMSTEDSSYSRIVNEDPNELDAEVGKMIYLPSDEEVEAYFDCQ